MPSTCASPRLAFEAHSPFAQRTLTLWGCTAIPLNSWTILEVLAMCTGRMPVYSPLICCSLQCRKGRRVAEPAMRHQRGVQRGKAVRRNCLQSSFGCSARATQLLRATPPDPRVD